MVKIENLIISNPLCLEHYKERLNELQQQQLQLEVQHEKMADNGKIDSDILRNIRSLYPSRIQASGFTAKSD